MSLNFVRLFRDTKWVGEFFGERDVVLSGHRATLLNDVAFVFSEIYFLIPQGFQYDGASIPELAWSFLGHPFSYGYRRPSALHDYLCKTKEVPSITAHFLFFMALLTEKVNPNRAFMMYFYLSIFGPHFRARTT